MAKSNAVWGIDIGQCALKALLCRPHEKDPRRLVVESFDFIEYPKILSQPEAEPAELIREALEQFLSRNEISGESVAISVAGQSGLARFIKLPPVESKKIPDIVKYEARQQIPFSLEDVVWDYQQLTGGSEEDGFALEPEVGLFAMKRDQVARALEPLENAGIEVDYIQLTPLAVYNYVCFDRLDELSSQPYDPAKPPPSTVVISLGADTTDLVVTNGYRVWQRNIPIGGNHFTRALSKELKLTFVKAEHVKRHATQADDPKAVFQAMRPVFSDLLAEIQRSLGYFMSIDKAAQIGEVIALGNAMKLPGLQRYLSQNLEQEVKTIESFDRLTAGSASGSAQFKDNVLSFAVAYGLCVQGLGKGELRTNLLPEELLRARLIRSKKPWAVAAAALVLVGITFNYMTHVSAYSETVTPEMESAVSTANSTHQSLSQFESTRSDIKAKGEEIKQTQANLISNVEGRLMWLELMKGLAAALPRDEREKEETAEAIMDRNEVHITSVDAEFYEDVGAEYFTLIESQYAIENGDAGEAGADEQSDQPADAPVGDDETAEGEVDELALEEEVVEPEEPPSGPGWVIQLTGHHYHNQDPTNEAARFVNNTLIENLETGTVMLPDGWDPNTERWTGEMVEVSLKELGVTHPWHVMGQRIKDEQIPLDPDLILGGYGGYGASSGRGVDASSSGDYETSAPAATGEEADESPKFLEVRRYDFVVQMVWKPTPRSARRDARLEREQEEASAAEFIE